MTPPITMGIKTMRKINFGKDSSPQMKYLIFLFSTSTCLDCGIISIFFLNHSGFSLSGLFPISINYLRKKNYTNFL